MSKNLVFWYINTHPETEFGHYNFFVNLHMITGVTKHKAVISPFVKFESSKKPIWLFMNCVRFYHRIRIKFSCHDNSLLFLDTNVKPVDYTSLMEEVTLIEGSEYAVQSLLSLRNIYLQIVGPMEQVVLAAKCNDLAVQKAFYVFITGVCKWFPPGGVVTVLCYADLLIWSRA